jgi:hypothetical protein
MSHHDGTEDNGVDPAEHAGSTEADHHHRGRANDPQSTTPGAAGGSGHGMHGGETEDRGRATENETETETETETD